MHNSWNSLRTDITALNSFKRVDVKILLAITALMKRIMIGQRFGTTLPASLIQGNDILCNIYFTKVITLCIASYLKKKKKFIYSAEPAIRLNGCIVSK